MNEIINNFQFIRPLFLLALLPIVLGYAVKLYLGSNDNLWQQIIPHHLYQGMTVNKGVAKSSKFIHVIFAMLCLSVVSIAGPTWEKLPQAVYQTQSGKVILLDMSMSMRATDLSPNRLARAKFKAIDLINEVQEGETGVVAYAGDAFVVSPLTDDANNLKTLIPALSPEIMPSQGSFALMGLEKANELLKNAGYQNGQIYWITDGIRYDEIRGIREYIQNLDFEVSALLIGTEEGAPILMEDGKMLKDSTGRIVIPSINERLLNQAMAGTSANYQLFANDNSDIQSIKRKIALSQQQQAQAVEDTNGDAFRDMGPYICLLLLPIVAYSFRKGVLAISLVSFVSIFSIVHSPPAFAQANSGQDSIDATTSNDSSRDRQPEITLANPNAKQESLLDLAFKNADQRGKIAFDNQDFEKAESLFKDPSWRAASAYKEQDFAQSETLYSSIYEQSGDLEALYNRGNALAKQGKLQEALDDYNEVLKQDQGHEKALQNKQIVEQLLNQQQQQNQQENQDQSGDDNKQDSDEQQSDNQDKQNQNEQQDQQNESGEQGEQDQSQEQQQNSDNKNSDENQQGQQNQQPQDQNDESLKQNAQKQETEEQEQNPEESSQDQQSSQNDHQAQNEQIPQEQQSAISNQINMDDLTPEEQEELQRMQMILNKVPDDPAYLLKRKMLLEAYKRKRALPPPNQENW